jgi:hypothetical protein
MKFNLGPKLFFSYFLIPYSREKRKSDRILVVEKESRLKPIPATKTGGFGVNEFLLI